MRGTHLDGQVQGADLLSRAGGTVGPSAVAPRHAGGDVAIETYQRRCSGQWPVQHVSARRNPRPFSFSLDVGRTQVLSPQALTPTLLRGAVHGASKLRSC